MKDKNQSKTALVTGASRGLGLALARALARGGWQLIVDAREEQALEAARLELEALTRVMAIPGDVGDPAHRQALSEAAREFGGLDAVVNNASTLNGGAPEALPELLDMPLEALERVFRTNLIAPLVVLQAARPHLKPGACIVNVSSDAAVNAYPGWGGYGSAKAALEQASAVLAEENPHLRVYWVDPGDMRTQMQQEAYPGEDISDRLPPEESVPGLLALLEGVPAPGSPAPENRLPGGHFPSGRYEARPLALSAGLAAPAEERPA